MSGIFGWRAGSSRYKLGKQTRDPKRTCASTLGAWKKIKKRWGEIYILIAIRKLTFLAALKENDEIVYSYFLSPGNSEPLQSWLNRDHSSLDCYSCNTSALIFQDSQKEAEELVGLQTELLTGLRPRFS